MEDTDFEAAGRRWTTRRRYRTGKAKKPLQYINVEIGQDNHAALKRIAQEEGLSMGECLDRILERFDRKRRRRAERIAANQFATERANV